MSQPRQPATAIAPRQSDFINDWAPRVEKMEDTVKPGGWRTTALPAAIVGSAVVVLYLISYYLLVRTPLGNATDAEIIAYYGDGTNLTLTLAGMLIMPFVGIAFLYFMVLLRATARATGLRAGRVLGNAPNIDALAAGGLLYNNMHTTALCSPSWPCILTGRNHHSNHMGCLANGPYDGSVRRVPRTHRPRYRRTDCVPQGAG